MAPLRLSQPLFESRNAEFPALAGRAGEGRDVLISRQWLVTTAHGLSWRHGGVKAANRDGDAGQPAKPGRFRALGSRLSR